VANNTTLNAGAGGDTYRSIDHSGVKTAVVGIDIGIGGSENLMSAGQQTMANSMPVVLASNHSVVPTSGGGSTTGTVTTGAGNTVIKASAGRLCRVLVTTAGTGSNQVLIYDNASTNSGTVIGVIPATIAIGTYYTFDMPAANGITVANVANGPALTVSYF
jgi:hypothetical protein